MRILAMFAKDLKSGFRNLEILFVVLVPVLLSQGYSIASSTLSSSRPKVVVCCPDESLKTTLSRIEGFKETRFTTDWNEAVSMVEAGKVHGAFLVPERFGSPEEREEKPVVVVVLDSASPIRASVVRRILKDFIDDYFNVDSPAEVPEEVGSQQ